MEMVETWYFQKWVSFGGIAEGVFWFQRRCLKFLISYMGVSAILVMLPGAFVQTFVLPPLGVSI